MFGRLKLVGLTIMVGAGRWHSDDYSAVVCVLTVVQVCIIPTSMFGVHVPCSFSLIVLLCWYRPPVVFIFVCCSLVVSSSYVCLNYFKKNILASRKRR